MHICKILPLFINPQNHISFSSKNNPDISVILPVYNKEKYIAKALDSLQNQTLENDEFICVNDGSKDGSLEIINEYAKKDNRIKIINQENKGTGIARNNGIKEAKGKYIAFLDSDDWFERDALQTAYKQAEKQHCDMLAFNFNYVDEKTGIAIPCDNIGKRLKNFSPSVDIGQNFNWRNIKPSVFRGMYWMAWNKIYNSSFLNKTKLLFSNGSLAEDNAFVFGATLKAKNIGYSDEYLHNYLQREGSALHNCKDANIDPLFQAIKDVKALLHKMGLKEELKEEYNGYIQKLFATHSTQIKSMDKLIERCGKDLSKEEYQIVMNTLKIMHVLTPNNWSKFIVK